MPREQLLRSSAALSAVPSAAPSARTRAWSTALRPPPQPPLPRLHALPMRLPPTWAEMEARHGEAMEAVKADHALALAAVSGDAEAQQREAMAEMAAAQVQD